MEKKIFYVFYWLVLGFLFQIPTANATLKTNVRANQTSATTPKKSRLETWAIQKSAKSRAALSQLVEKWTGRPLDPPDDDEPAEPFRFESPAERGRYGGKAGYRSKWAFWLILLSPFLFLLSIFQEISSGGDSTFPIIFLGTFITGIVFLVNSFRHEGSNFYNIAATVLLVLMLASIFSA